jgi:protein-L-isoaspartate(D-aspartate) O-methyltransferase
VSVDFKIARKNMLESQVRTNDVSDKNLIEAILKTPREDFTNGDKNFAYAEIELPTVSGRNIMKARDFSKLAQAASISKASEVLVIGGASLYSAAIFLEMGAQVTIIDSNDCALEGVTFVKGDITNLKELSGKKFDVIFVDGTVETVSSEWFTEVKDGGNLALFKYENGRSSGFLYVISGNTHSHRSLFEASVSKLPELNTKKEFVF